MQLPYYFVIILLYSIIYFEEFLINSTIYDFQSMV